MPFSLQSIFSHAFSQVPFLQYSPIWKKHSFGYFLISFLDLPCLRLTSICYSCNQVVCGSLLLLIAFLCIARVAVLKPTAGELCYSTLLLLRSENAWVCSEPPVECRKLCYSHNSTLITLTQTSEWLFMAVPTYGSALVLTMDLQKACWAHTRAFLRNCIVKNTPWCPSGVYSLWMDSEEMLCTWEFSISSLPQASQMKLPSGFFVCVCFTFIYSIKGIVYPKNAIM